MRKLLFVLAAISFSFAAVSQNTKVMIPNEKEALILIAVTNKADLPCVGDIIMFKGVKTNKTYKGVTDAVGKLSLLLPKGETYNVQYKELTDSTDYTQFEVPDKPGKFTYNMTIQIDNTKKVYTLENVFFDTGSSVLKPESYTALNNLVEAMKLKPTLVVEIAGHTDNTGTPEINIKLSQDRADAVRNYLIKNGVPANRVTAKGYGDTEPVADNSIDDGKAKNRRTEVRIIKE